MDNLFEFAYNLWNRLIGLVEVIYNILTEPINELINNIEAPDIIIDFLDIIFGWLGNYSLLELFVPLAGVFIILYLIKQFLPVA